MGLARELGADVVVNYSRPEWVALVREATDGKGAHVVLDGVGGRIGRASFDLTADGGRFLGFGVPGGGFTAIDPREADRRGMAVTSILELEWTATDVSRLPERTLAAAAAGRIRPIIGQTFRLERAADAHAAIEARDTLAKTLLLT